ncbi:MAG: FCD domain-containing protein [Nakamurella sp.]
MSGYPMLVESITRAREESFREINTLWLEAADESVFESFSGEHHETCAAIPDRNAPAAEAAMVEHLKRAWGEFTGRVAT